MGRSRSAGLPGGGAPVPDAERVAAIRFTILDDPDANATFAQAPHDALTAIHQQQDDDAVAGTLAECQAVLTRLKADVEALDVAALEPRKGLAGLFDSRARRLKAFRVAYGSAASAATRMADDIHRHASRIADRSEALNILWDEARDAIVELDAHIAAARAWLDDRADPGLPAPEASEPGPLAEPAPDPAAPHRLAIRVEDLTALRPPAIARLADLRAAQNAVHGVPAVLTALHDQVEAWRADGADVLGLSGRKPRKVRPAADRLVAARDSLALRISAALAEIGTAMERRAEIKARSLKPGPKAEDGTASQA
ncbi:toxic anion resistance protein [Brevundimonas subvibrioides]|uniref:toxic anion resistance protein n=1 Tax=Brevundimonas subvibrioides TaxID=74313 RepID=UPI0022B37FAF|nr:toxic anion resistance protein [Brevundimonas subvibrioides]